jgi:hypothetical protein
LEFPAIVREARRKQATLLFLDESAMHEDGAVATTWGPKGERPQVRVSGSRRRTNIISAVSPRGRLWFRCFRGTLTAARFIEFLRALQHDVRGEIVLVGLIHFLGHLERGGYDGSEDGRVDEEEQRGEGGTPAAA